MVEQAGKLRREEATGFPAKLYNQLLNPEEVNKSTPQFARELIRAHRHN